MISSVIAGCSGARLWILLGLLLPFSVFAQIEKVAKVETPIKTSYNNSYEVFPLGEEGVLTLEREEEFGFRDPKWHFVKYDTTLAYKWARSYKFEQKYSVLLAYNTQFDAYWLLSESDTEKYLFVKLNLQTGELDTQKGDLIKNITISEFKILGSKAVVAGYHRDRPIVLVHSFYDNTTKVLPNLYERNSELSSIEVNDQTGTIHVLTYAYKKKNCLFQIKTYDYEGKLLKTAALSDSKNSIISGQILPLNDFDSFLIGNYSSGCTPYSQGLYLAKIFEDEPEKPEFIEFSKLQNFFNYLRPKRKAKKLEKLEARKQKGKENRFRYRLLVHNLIQTKDEIILLAEIYYPNYRSNYTNLNSSQTSFRNYSNYRQQQGFQYTHAIVCGFDKQGNYKWDNSIAIKNLSSFELTEMVQLTPAGDYFVLAYPEEGYIHTEVIKREKVVVETQKVQIEPKAKMGNFNEQTTLTAWYGQNFLSYGIQKASENRMRTDEVFALTKLQYKISEIDNGKPDGKAETSIRKASSPK